MGNKAKTLEDFKKDLVSLTAQFEQAKQQVGLVLGAKLYVEQEIAKLEKEEPAAKEEVKADGS